jgi:hypothetical protein
MHWEKLPEVKHNEDASRDYEREESKRIAKLVKRAIWIALPLAVLITWWLSR